MVTKDPEPTIHITPTQNQSGMISCCPQTGPFTYMMTTKTEVTTVQRISRSPQCSSHTKPTGYTCILLLGTVFTLIHHNSLLHLTLLVRITNFVISAGGLDSLSNLVACSSLSDSLPDCRKKLSFKARNTPKLYYHH